MKVLASGRHRDLVYSLWALFEKRLGFTFYSPHGKEWDEIIGPSMTRDEYRRTENEIEFYKRSQDDMTIRLVPFERFKTMKIDILICPTSCQEQRLYPLMQQYQPNSIFIRQIGNCKAQPVFAKNILLARRHKIKKEANYIIYHPEHPTRFSFNPNIQPTKSIKSFSNYLRHRKELASHWDEMKTHLPKFEFRMHGNQCDDGWIKHSQLHTCMQNSMFIWHTKGCGFVPREALSCGKPLLVYKRFNNRDKDLSSKYLIDGENCLDIDPQVRSIEESVEIIREWSKPEIYKKKVQDVLRLNREFFNFAHEARLVKEWIKTLKPGV